MDREHSREVNYDIKLPESELDVMMAIWSLEPPATSSKLMKVLGNDRGWKVPTLISFLNRLEDRGFIESFKNGKERSYIAIADKDEYLHRLSNTFVEKYHGGSIGEFLNSLYRGKMLDNNDIDALLTWLKAKYN
ncbi:MAG: BlaI/MecI/CopY family transcriptional regulator [Clostridia bacterium]|nr:BlaI/MecI/CopY family transcriptional regulator [Clostridia bacterium]